MVSIMRSDQTLRLIQLYHANYPDIARNNQDADGRNLKLHMWARITEELNRTFGTAFTVEQFKKKVQNVQCTSRQKLFSGKRNLGEAEVEYLRLFESDKISEQTLAQRAKNRRSVSSTATTADFLREQRLKGEREGEEEDEEREAGEEEDEQQEGGSGTEEGGTTGANSPSGDCTDAVAALSSLAALFSVAGECQQTQLATPLQPPQPQQQMDGAQQFLLAMLSASLNQMPTMVEAGRTAHGSGAERKRNATEEGGRREKEAKGTKRIRAEEKNGEEKEGTKRSRLEEKEGMKRMEEKEWEEKEKNGEEKEKEGEREEKGKKVQNAPMMVVASAEGRQGEEHLWKTQMLQMQREELERQRQMVGPQLGPDNHSPPAQLQPHQSHPPHQFLPASSPSSSSSSRPDHCCQMFGPKLSSVCCCPSSELCARLDQTNAMLARIVQLITERLPPARDHQQE